jgi:hypothetical protein
LLCGQAIHLFQWNINSVIGEHAFQRGEWLCFFAGLSRVGVHGKHSGRLRAKREQYGVGDALRHRTIHSASVGEVGLPFFAGRVFVGVFVGHAINLANCWLIARKKNAENENNSKEATTDIWLGDGKWDVIHFNFGIHDRATKPADYEDRLEQIVARLKKTGAKLIWATTTPIPPDTKDGPTATTAIVEKNEIAAQVMQKDGVAIDDLFTFITPHLAQVQNPKDVHYNAEGYKLLGGQVADSIRKALGK